jgi:hypothetical protein
MTGSSEVDEEELAKVYLRQYATKSKEDFWAYEQVSDLVRNNPQVGWRIARRLIDLAPDDAALAYVAAGPLEDTVNRWGTSFERRSNEKRDGTVVSWGH